MSLSSEKKGSFHLQDNGYDIRPPMYSPANTSPINDVENEKSDKLLDLEDRKYNETKRSEVDNSILRFSDSSKLHFQSFIGEKRDQQERDDFVRNIVKFLITLSLCTAYIWVTMVWMSKSAISEFQKRIFNTLVTSISIGLGLNISSAFRDIALTIRWSVLALGRQNLEEMNLILQPESLLTISKLAFVSRRPFIIFGCFGWLAINIIIQGGLALVGLTYNFDIDSNAVQLRHGEAAIPKMDHFYPQTNHVVNGQSLQDEQYTAHTYGENALNFGIGLVGSEPSPGKRYLPTDPLLWLDKSNSLLNFIFLDSPKDSLVIDSYSAFTDRRITVSYKCESFRVLSGGDGTKTQINVDRVGEVLLPQVVPNSTVFLTRPNHICIDNVRCSIVEAFESSDTDPWFYVCKITLGLTRNDPQGIAYVSDYLAQIATASISQVGYTDMRGYATQIYPRESLWSQPAGGDSGSVGMVMSICAIGAIAGAAQFNPFTGYITPHAPSPGFILKLNHSKVFFSIFALVNITHLVLIIVFTIASQKVKAGPHEITEMSLLLMPITDRLAQFPGRDMEKEYKKLIRQTYVRYENVGKEDGWQLTIQSR